VAPSSREKSKKSPASKARQASGEKVSERAVGAARARKAPAKDKSSARAVAGHKKLKVALLGFGTVGRSVAKLLCLDSHGPFVLTHIFNRNIEKKKVEGFPAHIRWTDDIDKIISSDVDVVVELIGGIEPAGEWIRRALRAGKSVVSANKLLIAESGPQLVELARQMGRRLEFGASVAGGIPAIIAIQEGLAGDRLHRIAGILNGTCNYILTKMESTGAGFDAALKQAQSLGFAEANPRDDVEGFDARAKLVILTQAGLRLQVKPAQIPCWPIFSVEAIDFLYARELRCSIRQISMAVKEDTGDGFRLLAAVRPALVPLSSLVSHVQGSQNLVLASGEFAGQIALSGFGAGGDPTAVAVVSDLFSIARQADSPQNGYLPMMETPVSVSGDFTVPHYVRFVVKDRPGIVAEVAAVFSKYEIGIDALLQKPDYPRSALPFIMTLEACSSTLLGQALQEINSLDFHVQAPLCLPILLT
jgi:homoserine dehydrogenase